MIALGIVTMLVAGILSNAADNVWLTHDRGEDHPAYEIANVWAPVLFILGALVTFGFAAYEVFQ